MHVCQLLEILEDGDHRGASLSIKIAKFVINILIDCNASKQSRKTKNSTNSLTVQTTKLYGNDRAIHESSCLSWLTKPIYSFEGN